MFVFILFVRWFLHFSEFDGVWSLFGRSQFFCTCFQQWNVKQIELLRFFGTLLCSISAHIYSSLPSLIAFLFSVHRLASESINGLSKVTFQRFKWKDFILLWIERKNKDQHIQTKIENYIHGDSKATHLEHVFYHFLFLFLWIRDDEALWYGFRRRFQYLFPMVLSLFFFYSIQIEMGFNFFNRQILLHKCWDQHLTEIWD